MRALGLGVFLLPPDDPAQPLLQPVSQLNGMQAVAIGRQRGFRFGCQHVLVKYALVRCSRLVVLAGVSLAVAAFDLVDEHLARSEEVAEVGPFLAEPDQVVEQVVAVYPPFSEQLPSDGAVFLLDVGVVVAVPGPGSGQIHARPVLPEECRDVVVDDLRAVVSVQ